MHNLDIFCFTLFIVCVCMCWLLNWFELNSRIWPFGMLRKFIWLSSLYIFKYFFVLWLLSVYICNNYYYFMPYLCVRESARVRMLSARTHTHSSLHFLLVCFLFVNFWKKKKKKELLIYFNDAILFSFQ